MVQDTRGGGTSILGRRGQIPGPTPVAVPTRKSHVAELLSRLTLSTASSRAKADAKRSPAINSGHYFSNTVGANHIARTARTQIQPRPFIGKPTQVMSSTGATDGITHIQGAFSNATAATSEVTVHSARQDKGQPTAITTNSASRHTSALSPLPKPTPIIPTITPKKPTSGETGRNSPFKQKKAVGRASALGRTSAMGRTSALRNPSRAPGGFSRVQELKLKVSELERVMSQTSADKELIAIQAARIRELEDQRNSGDEVSIASGSTVAYNQHPMRRISQISSIDKWEQQEISLKQREERIRMREDRVARAETQAKAAEADAKAAVAERDSIQKKLTHLEAQRRADREKLEDLYEQLDATKNSRDSLQRQVTAFQVSQRTLEKQLAIAQRDSRRAKRAVAALETNVNDLKITVEEKNMENDELNRSINRVMQQAASVLRPESSDSLLDHTPPL